MKSLNDRPRGAHRIVRGLLVGAAWGLPSGLLYGLSRALRSDYSWPWHLDFAACGVVFVIGSALVFAIGNVIAGRFDGAIKGAIVGLIVGIFASAWTAGWLADIYGDPSQFRILWLGIAIGGFPCALVGAISGAVIQRTRRAT